MAESGIGKLERVPLREVWKHEALDFTKWLEGNIDVLGELLDLVLTNVDREQDAGDFSVDLVAEDSLGEAVIIENQLGKSDHDHLGKLQTYLAALEAKTASAWSGTPAAIMGASIGDIATVRAQYHLRQMMVFLNMFLLNQPEMERLKHL